MVNTKNGLELVESKYELGLDKEKAEGRLISVAKQLKIKQVKLITKEIEEGYMKDGISLNYIPLWKLLMSV